jgi:hypothetical protein
MKPERSVLAGSRGAGQPERFCDGDRNELLCWSMGLGWQVARLAWRAAGADGPVMRAGSGAKVCRLLSGNAFPVPAAPVVP